MRAVNMIEISVIIPTYNRKDLLIRLINSLYNSECSRELYEVIIIDDGSTDGTEEMLKHLSNSYPDFLYERIENSGPGIARNIGVGLSRGRIIAFIDDDFIVSNNWLTEIKKTFEDKEKDVSLVYGKILAERISNAPFFHSWNLNLQREHIIGGSNIAIKKEVFLKIGGFDPKLSYWAEDWDLVARLKENKAQIIYNPDLVVTNRGSYKGFLLKDYLYTPSFWLRHDYLFSKHTGLSLRPFHLGLLKRNIIKITIVFLVFLVPLKLSYILRVFLLFVFIFLRNTMKVIRINQGFRYSDVRIKPLDALRYIFTSWSVDPLNLILFFWYRLF